jgi:hypothetical protein
LRFRACLALAAGEVEVAAALADDAYTIECRVHPTDAEANRALQACVANWQRRCYADLVEDLRPASATVTHR